MADKMEMENLPKHIAIIMDGNRRWAKENQLNYKEGHKAGAKTLEKITRFANKIGISYLTVYAFSTENWKRTEEEVGALMLLLKNYLDDFCKRIDTENVKIRVLGDTNVVSNSLQKSIREAEQRTANNTGVTLAIAFNYGGRNELVRAVKEISGKVRDGAIAIEEINEELLSNNLYTSGMPDPDLLIRTSGEMRTSNFLPWQLVYSEFYFTEKYWPDFEEEDLLVAIREYQKRTRKFGAK